jgi:biotin transport system substrate-specific component
MASSTFTLRSETDRWLIRAAAVLFGSALLWVSAKLQLPFWPVPMTMQTYVVLIIGGILGWRLGLATLATYLGEGAMGLPVFAGTPTNGIGLAYFAGPTGGYLAGYVLAVLLVGVILRNHSSPSILRVALALLVGELTILALGSCWLAVLLGWKEALVAGFGPFLFGDGLKLILAVATVVYVRARYRSELL